MKGTHGLIIITALLTSQLIGCGTTHHYLPAKPLARDEWTLSVNWHYDFDGRKSSLIVPEVSSYVGVGNDWNVGFGLQMPFSVSHLTAAKYYDSKPDDYWVPYIHLNQVFVGVSDNPFIEMGCQYSDNHDKFSQTFSFGLSYGSGSYCSGGLMLLDPEMRWNGIESFRLMPVITYRFGGRDVGVSYIHYHGQERNAVNSELEYFKAQNDTLLAIAPSEIDSVDTDGYVNEERSFNCKYAIYLKDGRVCEIGNHYLLCGGVFPAFLIFDREMRPAYQYFRRRGYEKVEVQIVSDNAGDRNHPNYVSTYAYLNMDSLFVRIANHRNIVIELFPVEELKKASKRSPFVSDHSISISYFPRIEK